MIVVTGAVVAKPDTFEKILKLSLEHVARSRKEPGCISHDVHVDCQNPMRLFFYERWQDEAAIRAHFQVPASRGFIKALKELGADTGAPEVLRAESMM